MKLEPFDRTKPAAWCFGHRRAREGMVSSNPAFRRGPMPGDLDEPCFRLGYVKGCKDATRGKLYEPDYGVSHASSYAEVGIRASGTGSSPIALAKLLDLIRED